MKPLMLVLVVLLALALATPASAAGTLGFNVSAYTVNSDAKRVMLDVVRSDPTGPCTVAYITIPGTARQGTNYVPGYGTLTFANGETTKHVNVTILDVLESTSSSSQFTVNLSIPSNASLDTGVATVTILNVHSQPTTYPWPRPMMAVNATIPAVGPQPTPINRPFWGWFTQMFGWLF